MENLPVEIAERITQYLTLQDMKASLWLTPAMRCSAERNSGAFDNFELRLDNGQTFVQLFAGYRLRFLQHITFTIQLPRINYNVGGGCRPLRENKATWKILHETLSDQIYFVFDTIRTVEDRAGRRNGPGRVHLSILGPEREMHAIAPLSLVHHPGWRVQLLHPERLPLLRSVQRLTMSPSPKREFFLDDDPSWEDATLHVKMDGRVLVDIVAKLPNLRAWKAGLGRDEWTARWDNPAVAYLRQDWAGPRRDSRLRLATALMHVELPVLLESADLNWLFDGTAAFDIDHATPQPDLVSPAANDPLSASLLSPLSFSQHLRRLQLCAVADDSLFGLSGCGMGAWPALESILVTLHIVDPRGQWYFVGPNGEGMSLAGTDITAASYPPWETTELDQAMARAISLEDCLFRDGLSYQNSHFRIRPNDTTMRPMLAAYAETITHMPVLTHAVLGWYLAWNPLARDIPVTLQRDVLGGYGTTEATGLDWGIGYQRVEVNEPPLRRRYLTWKVRDWRPNRELRVAFQNIGRSQGGDELRETWVTEEDDHSIDRADGILNPTDEMD